MEMKRYKLGEIGEIRMCKRILKEETNSVGGVPFFKIGTFGGQADVFITKEKFDEYKNAYSYPKKGDVLISAAGTIGRTVVFDGKDAYFQDSNIVWIENDESKVLNEYLFYCYKNIHWTTSVGSTILRLYNDDIRNTDIIVPPLSDQKKIASVLSALDDKIALNKKMNQKLEAMAKRLYDYWFVQYDFPDKNGHPYKTTGGSMTYNPTLKREIPAGWEVSSFTDFGFFKNGINYDKNEEGDETVKIVNVRNISDSTTYFNIDELDDITLKSDDIQKFVATPKDILLARSGSPGATRLLPQTDKKIIYCGFIIRYQLNEQDLDKQLYLFHVLKGYEQVTSTQSAGSILKNISQDTLNSLTVVMPQSNVLDDFNKKIAPIYSMLRKNISELNKLTILRDKLLPLLMNGQVVVG